ncbi:MAG: hypothetical protein A3F31_02470 [Candidatus Levybacteria bacterium RIFCSPHIGHO2_12_FULL_38_12]|nr:MAG: hypothetical protein A2770_01975 [Candidatus Levybacteria bacterium RIFCSPHIGHO2_01_FULL_38_12]OGH22741.1 MAG: hypothetical protein A3F31_02470 [Candidatus Levybacteria bacterium RIFCSPHIGHO2_12_FULL_38_12]OGH33495.1 MAG: hypothetical protein A3A47_01675 [Candidatus Levybacteria bacterium RIFCSPLOWO2_01_FULL_37_20]OGH44882.1 MAG: hypothetical protein A3J14_02625 [Candidatus Levybacteria bacterium RIFCSPLOWO2_02_FULL_37_18]OGH50378.1 MAG: hypothetical protein A3G13_00385 [Candidatus Levy
MSDEIFSSHTVDGIAPWNRKDIDAVSGKNTYGRIRRNMSLLVTKYVQPRKLVVAISHAQQLCEFMRRAGIPETRLPEYAGLAIVPAEDGGIKTVMLPTGIF